MCCCFYLFLTLAHATKSKLVEQVFARSNKNFSTLKASNNRFVSTVLQGSEKEHVN